jgi:hypothetical protein
MSASKPLRALSTADWPSTLTAIKAAAFLRDAIKATKPYVAPYNTAQSPAAEVAAHAEANVRAKLAWDKANVEFKGILLQHVGSELSALLQSAINEDKTAQEWLSLVEGHLKEVAVAGRIGIMRRYETFSFNPTSLGGGVITSFVTDADNLRQQVEFCGLHDLVTGAVWLQKLTGIVCRHPLLHGWQDRLTDKWESGRGPTTFATWSLALHTEWETQVTRFRAAQSSQQPRRGLLNLAVINIGGDYHDVGAASSGPTGPCNYCTKPGHLWRKCSSLAADKRAGRVHAFKAGPNAGQPVPNPGSQPANPAPRPGGGVTPRPGEKVIGAAMPELAAVGSTLPPGAIILDTGSGAAHVLGDPRFFKALSVCERRVRYGSAEPIVLEWEGPAVIRTNGGILNLPNVLLDPKLPYGIVSARLLETTQGIQLGKDPELTCYYFVKAGTDQILFTATLHEPSGCYLLGEASNAMVGTSLCA